MSYFINKQKVFISHKRIDGTASAEAVLLKQLLDDNRYLDVFMDVHEDTLGEFPESLSKKIDNSDSFVFLIPSDGNVSFLYDKEGWVYQEINYSTSKYLMALGTDKTRIQILPITFSKSFEWPDNLPKTISTIGAFEICRLNINKNPEEIQKKLANALNIHPRNRINWLGCAIFSILVALTTLFCVKLIKHYAEDSINEKRITFIKNSFSGKIANRIQPALITSANERIPLEDSICNFFKLRDLFYQKVEALPVINYRILRNDSFSIDNMGMIYKEYIDCGELSEILLVKTKYLLAAFFPFSIDTTDIGNQDIIKTTNLINQYEIVSDQLKYALKVSNIERERESIIYRDFNVFYDAKNNRKALQCAARFVCDYRYWDDINQKSILFEELAKECNMYLLSPWRERKK